MTILLFNVLRVTDQNFFSLKMMKEDVKAVIILENYNFHVGVTKLDIAQMHVFKKISIFI